jgi:hypothetical protein
VVWDDLDFSATNPKSPRVVWLSRTYFSYTIHPFCIPYALKPAKCFWQGYHLQFQVHTSRNPAPTSGCKSNRLEWASRGSEWESLWTISITGLSLSPAIAITLVP